MSNPGEVREFLASLFAANSRRRKRRGGGGQTASNAVVFFILSRAFASPVVLFKLRTVSAEVRMRVAVLAIKRESRVRNG